MNRSMNNEKVPVLSILFGFISWMNESFLKVYTERTLVLDEKSKELLKTAKWSIGNFKKTKHYRKFWISFLVKINGI